MKIEKMKKRLTLAFYILHFTFAILCVAAGGCSCEKARPFGTTKFGEKAHLYTLIGKGGLKMEVTDYGGKVNRLWVPDAKGELVDVTIGFDAPAGWETTDVYFGAIIGRVGNRISEGRFTLDGKEYVLDVNDADHHAHLHGGARGWYSYVWDAQPFTKGEDVGIVFTHTFPDGEAGYPGTVDAKVTYTITPENVWRLEYEATTDKPTPLNLTHHVYFNLDGSDTILDQQLKIAASKYSPCDANLKPVGPAKSVAGTPFDFREFHVIGERINAPDQVLQYGPGYDHNWVLDGSGFRKVAEMKGKSRRLEIWTDQIGLQFYAGNFIDNNWTMKDGRKMKRRSFLALETQHFPDSPNRPDFPSIILKPGETYRTTTEYRFR